VLVCPTCQAVYHAEERFCVRDASPLVAMEDDVDGDGELVGTSVGNYRIERVVGRGGMGTVYAAEHVYLGRMVALKILQRRYAMRIEAVQRFLHEARAATSINHPNIVEVLDFGPTADGRVYLAMELLDGSDLEKVLEREGRFSLHRSINIVSQIASALAAAHDKGIVHNDLKPANVMLLARQGRRDLIRHDRMDDDGLPRFVVEKEGTFDLVKLLDFGVARVQAPGSAAPVDGDPIYGTPQYMPPEAILRGAIDGRADIYALGVLFFEMLTGQVPFDGASPLEILERHVSAPPPRPSQVAPGVEISAAAEALILRALAKDPADRPQTMDEVREALAGCYGRIAYRRDAEHVPGAVARGLRDRRRLTEELDEWLARERERIERALRRE
jgi:eukaryotic-like serine/threonine-protein kinase